MIGAKTLALLAFAAAAVRGQPTIMADGDDLLLTGGARGDITFTASDGSLGSSGELTVREMYETMMAMKESVKNLKEENAAQAKDIIAMQKLVKDTVDSKATDLTSDIAVNTEAIEKLDKDTEAQLNQIGVDLVKLSQEETLTTCDKITVANSKLFVDGAAQSDFNAGKHVVGLKVNVKCADGYFATSTGAVACFPSGKYCPAADYPVDACHDDKIPRCEKCNDQCATCLEKDICTACKDPSKVFSKAVLKCVSESELLTTCSQLNKAKGVQSGQTVDLDVAKNPSNVASVKALCLTDSSGNMHTHVKCDALSGGPCSIYSLTTEENTCKVFGMIHGPVARSKSHFDNVFRSFDQATMNKYHTTIGGVSANIDGPGHNGWAQDPILNPDPIQAGKCTANSESTCKPWSFFKAVDGKDWWAQDQPQTAYSGFRNAEPSGDYAMDSLIVVQPYGSGRGTVQNPAWDASEGARWLNDGADGFVAQNIRARYNSGPYYMCTTSDYDA